MKFKHLFEMKGKGALPELSRKVQAVYQAVKREYHSVGEKNDYDKNDPLLKSLHAAKELATTRHGQAHYLTQATQKEFLSPDHRHALAAAQRVRMQGKLDSLDTSKPDEWLQKKRIEKLLAKGNDE